MDFTKGSIGRQIITFSIPIILGNLFQQLYSLVNSAFVGNFLGVKELAAIGATYPVVFFITSMILGIGSGGSVVVSHYYGAKDYSNVHKVISTFYIFFIALGLLICFLGIVFAKPIYALLNLENDVQQYAVAYFRIYMIGMFFSVLFHSAISILRGLGDSHTQLWFLIPANILNGILSYIFLGPMHLGIEASAWASVISQFLAFAILFLYLNKSHEFVRLPSLKHLCFNKEHLKQIVSVGVPTGVQQSIVALTQILILYLVAMFGTTATAAYSSASRIESIAMLFILNLSQALTSFVGTNIGAGLEDRSRQGLKVSIKIIAILSAITLAIFVCCDSWLISLFTTDSKVIEIGSEYLMITGCFWFLFSFMMMYTAFFRGIGHALITMMISFVCLWIIRFPVSWLLSKEFGTLGIWIGAPVSWLIADIIYILYYSRNKWTKARIIKTFLCFIFFFPCFNSFDAQCQTNKQNLMGLFANPMDLPITSTGNFAELRGSHFHSGLDIRTNGKTGYAVYAPADGYVSRIKVQAFGGGKNLYITHNNGYTTVYMHLEKYEGKIGEYVTEYQYSHKCYEFDHSFSKPEIYVKKGDLIGISGESGAVAGPHLHFEIRKTSNENPMDPLLFFDMHDTIAPYISSLAITPLEKSYIDGKKTTKTIDIAKDDFKEFDTLKAYGKIYFSILAFDESKGSNKRNGVLKTELFIDSTLYFAHQIDEFSWTNNGFVDAVINYPLYIKTGKRYLSSRLLKNGKLPYDTYKNKGILNTETDSIYLITWKLTDRKSNSTTYSFYIKGTIDTTINLQEDRQASVQYFDCNTDNSYMSIDSSVFIFPKNSLYESINFAYSSKKGTYSDIHNLHTIYEPVKKSFTIKLKPYKIDKDLEKKYLIVKVNGNNKLSAQGGFLKDGWVETKVGTFGTYAVWIDTIPPTIQALNFKDKKKITSKQKSLQIKISDNLSGILSYNAYLNNEWVLMEYDGKNARLTYTIDDKLKEGENTLKIIVYDKKNNVSTQEYTVIR